MAFDTTDPNSPYYWAQQRAQALRPIGGDMAQQNPSWARWFDTIAENTGGKRLRFAPQSGDRFVGDTAQPSLRGLQSLLGGTPYANMAVGRQWSTKRPKKYAPETAATDSPDTQYRF